MTTPRRLALTLATLCLSSCATTASPREEAAPAADDHEAAATVTADVAPSQMEHFVGTVTTTSPDGATPYGPPTETVAERAFFAQQKTIRERVFHDGALHTTTLTALADPNRYAVSDDVASFSGTISYDTITGSGTRTTEGFTTTKTFSAGGAPRAKIVEELRRVSAEELNARLEALLAAGGEG